MLRNPPLPDTWSKMGKAELDIVSVNRGSAEYACVEDMFKRTCSQATRIEKVDSFMV